uniref:Myc box-dependent-interacting protein 1 n=1 Tax=Mastacembelus armatus TaxID=205130 RepID=A0A3Q3SR15_9TELE
MAELNLGKGLTAGKVASNVQKKLTRAQEKVLQKLGKADETKDAAFEEGVINFNKQYVSTEGRKLQRDLRAYLEAVKAMHESSKNLQSCLVDMYEPEWYGKNDMDSIAEDCDVLWTDYHQKLVDHALISMDTYLGQFPDIKARIAKRDRKLVDFDSARHNYTATHKSKKKDGGIKITKPSTLLERATPGWAQGILSAHNVAQSSLSRSQAEEELERAQKVFEEINIDLQEELPSLWNSRVGFYVSTFQSLAGFEEKFHKEMSRVRLFYRRTVVLHLDKDQTKQKLTNGAEEEATPQHYDPVAAAVEAWGDDASQPVHYDPIAAATEGWGDDGNQPVRYDPVAVPQEGWDDDEKQPVHYDTMAEAQADWGDDGSQPGTEVPATENETPAAEAPVDTTEEEATPTPAVAAESTEAAPEPAEMPPGFMFKVQVMHDYAANDIDELEMKAGDLVLVILFDNPDEQDEGWLMGIKQDDWQQNKENATKGVFPENFTQRL